jgi:hypothetical protein
MVDEGEGGPPPEAPDNEKPPGMDREHRQEASARLKKMHEQNSVPRGTDRPGAAANIAHKETPPPNIVQQVLVDARSLDFVVDEFEVTADLELRQVLLQQGLTSSIDGLGRVVEEPFVKDPRGYLEGLEGVEWSDGWKVSDGLAALRGDAVLLKTFLSAECRMLTDLGLPPSAVARTRTAMAWVIVETQFSPEQRSGQVPELLKELTKDRERARTPETHHKIWRRLTGVLEALGGVLVVCADTTVGLAAAPLTVGVSVYGASLSQVAGGYVIGDGVKRALRG